MNIAIDIDDTLAQTSEYFMPFIATYFHVDEAELWEKNITYDDLPAEWQDRKDDFYRSYFDRVVPLTPFKPGAARAVDALRARGHRIVILTARSTRYYTDPYATTVEQLRRGGIAYDKLICERDKAAACLREKIDVLIDDYLPNCDAVAAVGVAIINMRSLANRNAQPPYPRVDDWKEALAAVLRMEDKTGEPPANEY